MAWSCSEESEAPPEARPSCTTTVALDLGELKPRSEAGWYEAEATGGGKKMTLRIELNGNATAPLEPGKYSLGIGQDADYGTCQRCVLLLEGSTEPEEASRVFFAIGGTMTLDAVSNPATSTSKGRLSGVTLREMTLDKATSKMRAKSGGRCFSFKSMAWDNEPKEGAGCKGPLDCGDPAVAACDPSGKCVVRQCDFDGKSPCPEGSICLAQTIEAVYGTCHKLCDTRLNNCGGGLECLPLDAESTEGKCVATGPALLAQDCDETPANTGCAPGLRCVHDGDGGEDTVPGNPVCRRSCDFFGSASCPSGERCAYGGFCTPMEYDPSPLDDLCATTSTIGTLCGAEPGAYRGLCVPSPELSDRLACRRACPSEGPKICPEGQYCGGVEGESVAASVCRPFVADEVQP